MFKNINVRVEIVSFCPKVETDDIIPTLQKLGYRTPVSKNQEYLTRSLQRQGALGKQQTENL